MASYELSALSQIETIRATVLMMVMSNAMMKGCPSTGFWRRMVVDMWWGNEVFWLSG